MILQKSARSNFGFLYAIPRSGTDLAPFARRVRVPWHQHASNSQHGVVLLDGPEGSNKD